MPFCHVTLTAGKPPSTGFPKVLHTIGDHLRHHRLKAGSLQRDVAQEIGVFTETVRNWELGHTEPAIRHFPAINRFLGYIPMPRPTTLAEELCTFRKLKGISRKEFARRIGVDPETV